MAREKSIGTKRPIESYQHKDKERVNNPPAGLVTLGTDPDSGQHRKRYAYDPHLEPELDFDPKRVRDELADVVEQGLQAPTLEQAKKAFETLKKAQEPYLNWSGKAERTSFEVPTVSLHVHERIDPRTVIEAVRRRNGKGGPKQPALFEEERQEPLRQAIEFYRHKHGWSNRLITGDSLLVMNSLLEKEGMAGKVQMIYIDPPYGIKYGSNFQPFVNKRDVRDGKDEDLTAEPEQIKAFRDTWELGIHSYLTYLRDRLLLARELLTESGSIFVQISSENRHHVRELMDELFGTGNFIEEIAFRKKNMTLGGTLLEGICDYLIWYARNRDATKFRRLFMVTEIQGDTHWNMFELPDGSRHQMTRDQVDDHTLLPDGARVFTLLSLYPAGSFDTGIYEFTFEGRKYRPPAGRSWKSPIDGMQRLVFANRILPYRGGNTIRYVLRHADYPVSPIHNVWLDTAPAADKRYVVQTAETVIQRCLLMTTDPGDLVFDPTCGSGTTAYVAEQWGRRWITCDTSRVAITLARQRLMTAVFDYYELAHPEEGVGSGFRYKTVPHVRLKSIANNPEIDGIFARMHPAIEQALAALNQALRRDPPKPFRVNQGGRAGKDVDFRKPGAETVMLPSGQQAPAGALLEWEVPSEFPTVWPETARPLFDAFHSARRAMQRAMDEAIARHADQETLYDQPFVDRRKVRVTGPFTVEAVPAPAVKSVDEILEPQPGPSDASIARSGETLRQAEWRDELLKAGIRGKNGQYIRFSRLEPLPGCRSLHADGETRPSSEGADRVRELGPGYLPLRAVVSFGPEHGPLEQRQVEQAIEEAQRLVPRPSLIIFAAFQFDPEAAKDIDETNWPGVTLIKVQMNADLLTEDLKKKRASNESFWLIGQPDVDVESVTDGEDRGRLRVIVHGFDYYNTKTGCIESGSADRIAVWMLDTDYDGRSLYPRQVFFPMAEESEGWAKLAKNLKAEIDEERIEAYRGTVSLPFEPGEHKRIAVKIVDDRGIESLRVVEVG